MPKALILGISGGFGAATAEALRAHGWQLRALMREPTHLPPHLDGTEIVCGDARDHDAVWRATEDVEMIVYAANPSNYRWRGTALPMLEVTACIAEARGLTILFPANVYVFDPADGPIFDETSPRHPQTGKGHLRLAMEVRLERAARRGARVIVLRMGDFFGPHAPSAWLHHLIRRQASGCWLTTPGPSAMTHTWAYLPDAANVAAALIATRDNLPAWNLFHFHGHRASLAEIAAALQSISGQPVVLHPMRWWPLHLLAPFSPLARGVLEMRYFWRCEIHLDDRKLCEIGLTTTHTPLGEALRRS